MMKFLSRLVDSNEREVRRLEPLVAAHQRARAGVRSHLRRRAARHHRPVPRPAARRARRPADPDRAARRPTPGEEEESELAGADPARHSEERKEQRKRERAQIDAALDEVLPEAFAAVREAMRRALGKRHYDVQLIGGMVLHRGAIAEMKTGEGKTFVAPLAAYLNGLTGRGVHVVTVNDYLAKRDAQWIGAVFHRLGMTVG